MTRAQPPRDRRWSDPAGRRRASVEFGGKSAGRKPRERRRRGTDRRSVWQRQADRSRRLVRYGAKHKAGLLGWAGILSALTCMWAFTGVTQLVTVGVSLGAAGGGAAIRHHQRNKTYNSGGARRATAKDIREHHDAMLRTGRPASPAAAGETETVRAHTNDGHGVRTYTRQKAGSKASSGDHTVVTYRMRDGREAMTTATGEQREALRRAGRLLKDHGKPDVKL